MLWSLFIPTINRYLSVFPSLWFSPGIMFRWRNLSKAALCHEPKRKGGREKTFLAKKWDQTEQFWNFFICVLWDMCLRSWWFLCCRKLGCAIRSYSSGSPVRAFLPALNFQILNVKWFWWLVLGNSDNVMCHLSLWVKSLFGWFVCLFGVFHLGFFWKMCLGKLSLLSRYQTFWAHLRERNVQRWPQADWDFIAFFLMWNLLLKLQLL